MSQEQATTRTCQEDACDEVVWARGWCQYHYNKWYRRTHPPKKVDRSEYHRGWYLANRERLLEHQRQMRVAHPERERQRHLRWREKNPESYQRTIRRHKAKRYDLTLEEYDAIIARGCALCGTHEAQICIDHDHTSGKVRDALCKGCNTGLGLFGDDAARLRAAAAYIESHQ